MKIASVLLAAGAGTRFQASLADWALRAVDLDGHRESNPGAGNANPPTTHKLLARMSDGRTVVEHSYAAMRINHSLDHGPLIVVQGAVELPLLPGSTVINNDQWAQGQSTSLRAAIACADSLHCDAVVVGLGDQPAISPHDWSAVRKAVVRGASIAVATFDGKRRNPVGLARSVWPLLPTDADEGARTVMRRNPELVTEVPCSGNSADIDTVEDLLRWPLN